MIVVTSSHSNFLPQPKKLTPQGTHISSITFSTPSISLLQNCSSVHELQQLHAQMIKSGTINDPFIINKLISLCSISDFSCLSYILRVLFSISYPNSIIWNTLIKEFSLSSMPEQSIFLFKKMLEEEPFCVNSYVYPSILKACSRILGLSEGTQIHGSAIKLNTISDPYIQNAMMLVYMKCGQLLSARHLFDNMSEKSVVSWNTIIMGYAEVGQWEDVKSLFWSMVEQSSFVPDSITLVRMLTACTRSGDFNSGKCVHRYIEEMEFRMCLNLGNALMNVYAKMGEMGDACRLFEQMPEWDVVSWTTLVSGYVGLGCMGSAREIFNRMPNRNVVSWNAMIAGYVSNGCFREAIWLFKDMLVHDMKPDKATIVSVLSACMGLEDQFTGTMVHGYISKGVIEVTLDLFNSLIGMYSKCGGMDSAKLLFKRMTIRDEISETLMMVGYVNAGEKEVALEIFNKMPNKDIASWNALIAACAQCNYFNEALGIFIEMLRARVTPNGLTLVSTLSACARVGALELGKWVHAYINRNNIKMDSHLVSSLIDMYAKCGRIELSLEVFNKIHAKDLLNWSTMIGGLAMHGHGRFALKLFHEMLQGGMQPDHITFVGVLSACSHAGLVDQGRYYFDLMTKVYNLSPKVEHYSCMVDMFGRRGLLEEAKDFIKGMPRSLKGEAIWGALLGACSVHDNFELAEYAANQLLKVDPSHSGAYVLLSHAYAKASKWNDVGRVRKMMKGKEIQKFPGCSSIEVNGAVHEFFVGDISHPQCNEIYTILHELKRQMDSIEYLIDIEHLL